jgi:hypothetical protein
MLQVMREGRDYCPVLFVPHARRGWLSRLTGRDE